MSEIHVEWLSAFCWIYLHDNTAVVILNYVFFVASQRGLHVELGLWLAANGAKQKTPR